jgi:hypothetical protein
MLLTDLNDDCFEQISKHLDLADYIKFSKVNIEINSLLQQNHLQQNYLWKQFFIKTYRNVSEQYLINRFFLNTIPDKKINWKDTIKLFSHSNLLLKIIKSQYYSPRAFIINNKNKVCKIGRSRSNNIDLLYDEIVSRFHCKIMHLYGHYWIQDVSSSNGTKINNKYIPFNILVKLNNNDVISFGRTYLKINYINSLTNYIS